MFARLKQLLVEEQGQDLVEYALLTGFIALATAAGFNAITGALNFSYGTWDSSNHQIWQPPAPLP